MLVEKLTIRKIGEVKDGVSETTGRAWATRNILLGFEDETGESYISAAVDNQVWQRLGYAEGQTVGLHLRFRTKRLGGGFVFTEVRILDPMLIANRQNA